MNCEWIQRLMAVHRELDRPERRAVAAHLRVCDDCKVAWQEETRVKAVIAAIPDLEPPPGLEARLLRIPSPPPPPPSGPGLGPTLLGPTGGSVLLAALVIGASLLVAPHLVRPNAQAAASGAAMGVAADQPHEAATVVTRHQPPRPSRSLAASVSIAAAAHAEIGHPDLDSSSGPRSAPQSADAAAVDGQRSTLSPADGSPPSPGAHDGQVPSDRPAVVPPSGGPAAEDPGRETVVETPAGPQPMISPIPATPSPTPATCSNVSLQVFADVAGAGALGCAGCDGRFDDLDASLAEGHGVTLPALEIRVIDSAEVVVYEGLILADGASVWVALPELCGSWPMTAHLVDLPGAWSACPATGSLSRRLDSDGDPAAFPLTSGCVESTATLVPLTPMPTATALPTETPDPVVTPSPQPDPGGHATAQWEPTATRSPQSDPTSLPTTIPEPSATPAPTDEYGVAATPAARLRRTPTPTPILRTEQTPPSWLLPSPSPTPKPRRPSDPFGGGR